MLDTPKIVTTLDRVVTKVSAVTPEPLHELFQQLVSLLFPYILQSPPYNSDSLKHVKAL